MQEPGMQPPYNQGQYGQGQYGQAPIPPASGYMPMAQTQSGIHTLRRIDVGSAFKIGAIMTGLIYAVLGLPFMFIMSMAARMMPTGASGAGMAGGGIIGYIMMVIFGAVFGGIFGAVYAAIYNVVSGWVGGLQVEVS